MGMDVHGKTNEAYFRASVWGWHPLAEFIIETYPDLAGKVKYWHSNDGDGLNEKDSRKLARRLRKDLESGEVRRYVATRDRRLARLPRVTCEICQGKGMRTHEDNVRIGVADSPYFQNWEPKTCNGCNGLGDKAPWEASYRLDVEDVQEFATFLEECDGFEIW